MTGQQQDRERTRELARQVANDFGASLTVALGYIGDRLGLFRTMAEAGPLTTQELSDRTGLNERYLREWAATMAAAHYIDYDPATRKFAISPEQATVLLDQHSPYYMGGAFLYAQASIRQLPALMAAFRDGGGVPFGDFGPEIVEAIEGLFQAGYETAVAADWIPAVPGLHEKLVAGATVAEVGCGAGQCLVPVASAYPNSRFVGYDIDVPSLERAGEKAAAAGVAGRVAFETVPAEELSPDAGFDLVMAFNCIHDMSDPRGALRGIRRALSDDGVFLWSEANASDRLEDNLTPMGRTLYGASTMHCMTVSLAGGGEGLGTVIGPGQAQAMAVEAGFTRFERLPVEHPYHQVFALRP